MRYSEFKIVENRFRLYELTDKVKNQMREKFKGENETLTDAQIDYYLDKWDQYVGAFEPQYRDITKLTFTQVEQLIDDAVARSEIKGKQRNLPKFDQNDDMIYNRNNMVILKGDLREKCIQYGDGYSWCISRTDASNMFFSYRMRMNEPMFYFVFDKDRPTEDVWHAVVIYVDNQGTYHVATALNPGDKEMTWNQITQKQPKLRGLEKLFVHQPLTPQERVDYEKYGKPVVLEKYKSYRLSEKLKYIKFGHVLSDEEQDATPDELIPVYAKGMPSKISKTSWNRLKSGDKRYIVDMFGDQITEWYKVQNFIRNIGAEPIIEKIAANIEWAYAYAHDVLEKRWDGPSADAAEATIASDPEWAYDYARYVLRKRWDGPAAAAAEASIANYSIWAYDYARDILHKRWDGPSADAAEKSIASDPNLAYNYALDVLRKRWDGPHADTAEANIASNPRLAHYYARYVLRKRWDGPSADAAEKNIMNSKYADEYKRIIRRGNE